jgi:uncharacterized protein YlxW (UPF0749 family)
MGCGGGFNDLFRVYGNSCNSGHTGNNGYRPDDTQEKISLIKRLYAEGKIDRDRYYSLKDRAYNGSLSFEQLMDIKEFGLNMKTASSREDSTKKAKQNNTNTSLNKYKEKVKKLEGSKEKVESIKSRIQERLQELLQEREKMEGIAESMVSSSEEVAKEFIGKKLDIVENIQTLKKRKKELANQIDEIEKTIKSVETKLLDYEAVKLQEELENLKKDI